MTTTQLNTHLPHQPKPTNEDIEAISSQWREAISDPAPEAGTIYDWIRRYGKQIVSNAIAQTRRKYTYMFKNGEQMTYEHALRYTSACARNARNEANEFHAPKEWLQPTE